MKLAGLSSNVRDGRQPVDPIPRKGLEQVETPRAFAVPPFLPVLVQVFLVEMYIDLPRPLVSLEPYGHRRVCNFRL
jgi:hypothetical protein